MSVCHRLNGIADLIIDLAAASAIAVHAVICAALAGMILPVAVAVGGIETRIKPCAFGN